MTDQATVRMTIAEYQQLPESTLHQELINGALFVAPAPKEDHQAASTELIYFIRSIVGKRGKVRHQPTDVYINPSTVLQPDVFWADDGGLCVLGDDGYWHGAPELVIEIVSPGTEARDRGVKYDLYEQAGVYEYWLVNPSERFLEVYVRRADRLQRQGVYRADDRFNSPILQTSVPVHQILGR